MKLTVVATVLKHARFDIRAQPTTLVVTDADIARGYVDVSNAGQVAIRSNSSAGYMLEFATEGEFLRQVRVTGLGRELEIGPAGGFVVQPSTGSALTGTTLNLGFRFVLAESARAGTYPWPVHLSFMPL